MPSDEDIISFRHRKGNNHLSETTINVRRDKFIIYDVNYDINYLSQSQQSRSITNRCSKWMHCFDNSTALIFVASLISYSQYIIDEEQSYLDRLKMKIAMDILIDIVGADCLELILSFIDDPFECNRKNAMIESIKLFDHIINNRYFYDTPIILMLNKKDLLLHQYNLIKK